VGFPDFGVGALLWPCRWGTLDYQRGKKMRDLWCLCLFIAI